MAQFQAFRLVTFLAANLFYTVEAHGNHSQARCGPLGRYCERTAYCIRHIHRCQCPPGKHGDGFLDCVDSGYHQCVVSEDPKLRPFPGGRRVGLFLPCQHRLAVFYVPIEAHDDTVCRFHITGTSELVDTGYFYEGELSVGVDFGHIQQAYPPYYVKTNGTQADLFMTINRHGVQWNYEDVAASGPWQKSPWGNNITVSVCGHHISVTYDVSDNLLTYSAPSCGHTRLRFRPFVPGRRIQTRVPGISIAAPASAQFVDSWSQFPRSLCHAASADAEIVERQGKALGLGLNQYVMFAALRYAPQEFGQCKYKASCELTLTTFNKECPDARRVRAVRVCYHLLSVPRLLACLLTNGDYRPPADPVKLFQKCISFICFHDTTTCLSLTQALSNCSHLVPRVLNRAIQRC